MEGMILMVASSRESSGGINRELDFRDTRLIFEERRMLMKVFYSGEIEG